MFQIDFQPIGKRIQIAPGQTLLEAAQNAGVELTAVCGGMGICGGCRIRLGRGVLSASTPAEQAVLSAEEITSGQRLACQAFPQSDCTVIIPPDSLSAPQRLQLEDRLEHSEQPQLAAFEPSQLEPHAPLGLAFDLGTTKLAAYLVNLSSGETLSRAGAMNPQIGYGEDIIARIHYANTHPNGRAALQACLIQTLNGLITELCQSVGAQPERIRQVVAVGNTVMHHLFIGLPVQSLGRAPYRPATVQALDLTASEVGLALAPTARLYLPPNIAGYVGADHVAALLALGEQQPRVGMLLDIGTNTEISLFVDGRILSCSCASGPAFEGARLRDGMRAAAGAIERVQIRQGDIRFHTIGQRPPIGLCGSGILDAVAELLNAGALDERGNFVAGHPLTMSGQHGGAVLLVAAEKSAHHRDILVTRQDVNEIQLAKGAIRAGVETLLAQANLRAEALEDFIVAGAFGTYLDIHSAVRVGMFPDLPCGRFRQVGNAAGAGARRLLWDAAARQRAEALAQRVTYVELAASALFRRQFSRQILFTSTQRQPPADFHPPA